MDLHLLYKIINFLIFVGLLAFFLRKPLKEFWWARAEALRLRISNALKARQTAEAQYKQLMSRVNRMAQEMRVLKDKMREDALLEKEQLIEQAQVYADKLEEVAGRIGEQELAKLRYLLKEQVARSAVELAARHLQEKITAGDQERLITGYLDRLQGEEFPHYEGGLA